MIVWARHCQASPAIGEIVCPNPDAAKAAATLAAFFVEIDFALVSEVLVKTKTPLRIGEAFLKDLLGR